MNSFAIRLIALYVLIIAAVMVTLVALQRWQRRIWMREREEGAKGFEVITKERRSDQQE
jgi:uncharacterized membrane protein YidH (DUF202 family)